MEDRSTSSYSPQRAGVAASVDRAKPWGQRCPCCLFRGRVRSVVRLKILPAETRTASNTQAAEKNRLWPGKFQFRYQPNLCAILRKITSNRTSSHEIFTSSQDCGRTTGKPEVILCCACKVPSQKLAARCCTEVCGGLSRAVLFDGLRLVAPLIHSFYERTDVEFQLVLPSK